MGDDHTTQAISCYDGIFKDYTQTANIDRLASEGILFQNAFCTNAICSPARATLLTGKYSHKNGVRCLGQKFDTTQTTIGTELQKAGYETAVFGKWHLKSTPTGFDDYKVLQVQRRYENPEFKEKGGKLFQFLKENDLYDNTIIIYKADQGHFLGEHGFFSKRLMYEEAVRIPLIVRYPNWISPGTINEDMSSNADIAPTILEMAGIGTMPEMQGRSFLNNLKGNTPSDWPEAVYYHYWQHLLHRDVAAHFGVRTKTHKLIFYFGLPLGQTDYPATTPEWEMFDLVSDPDEMNNVYNRSEYARNQNVLKGKLRELQDKYDDRGMEYSELQDVIKKYW